MRDQCYIKIRQTQGVCSAMLAGPFRFAGLNFDENNWQFVFAALLQALRGVLVVFLLEGVTAFARPKKKGKLGPLPIFVQMSRKHA